MPYLPVLNSVFPFICSNRDCSHVYDLEDFIHVALLWGFIYFESRNHQIIGLTCPNCPRFGDTQTTLKKYPIKTEDFSIEIINESAKKLIPGVKKEDLRFTYYIPFSKKILYWYFTRRQANVPHYHRVNIPKFPVLESAEQELFPEHYQSRYFRRLGKREQFSIPWQISLFDHQYPDVATKDFHTSFTEDYLLHCCDVERVQRLKAMPRIVSNNSIYIYSDALFRDFKQSDFLSNKEIKELTEAFEKMVRFESFSRYKNLILNEENDLSEYVPLFKDILESLRLGNSKEKIIDFFNGYARVRNYIDFNQNYRDKFDKNFLQELGQIKKRAEAQYQFFQEGSTWTIVFSGKKTSSLKGKGFKYIHFLISRLNEEFKTVELDADESTVSRIGGTVVTEPQKEMGNESSSSKKKNKEKENADYKKLIEYRKVLHDLKNERSQAEEENDDLLIKDINDQVKLINREIEELLKQLGKKHFQGDDYAKTKNRITKRIERALTIIEKNNTAAFEHLNKALKPINSYTLSYRPAQAIDWQLTPN